MRKGRLIQTSASTASRKKQRVKSKGGRTISSPDGTRPALFKFLGETPPADAPYRPGSNEALASSLQSLNSKLILAPLTTGGNVPFRSLCNELGAEATWSEMIFARSLLRGHPIERARLRHAHHEKLYGLQIAVNNIDEGREALDAAYYSSASFVDLNCGCPKQEITSKGLGAALLRKPSKLGRLVDGLTQSSDGVLPLTVKVRLSPGGEEERNIFELAHAVEDNGGAALTVHGRTKEARYTKQADWHTINEVAQSMRIPVVGNGDVLTLPELRLRLQAAPAVDAVMAGRGALIRPELFLEATTGKEWHPSATERIKRVYFRLAELFKQHFGRDRVGYEQFSTFMPWHLNFLQRARPFPSSVYEASLERPLIQQRFHRVMPHEDEAGVSTLQLLLRTEGQETCDRISDVLWHCTSAEDAVAKLQQLAEEQRGSEVSVDAPTVKETETTALAG